jgi:2-polyprenyl-6-methoxyphenol hydroxylase-like FAD-dependent oxidoreductase
MTSKLRVGIVGGSIAGCATAGALLRVGCDVTVFERTSDPLKDRGAGITVIPSALQGFIEKGLLDSAIPHYHYRSFTPVWRTEKEPLLGYCPGVQPLQSIALNWGGLYQSLRRGVPDEVYYRGMNVRGVGQNSAESAVVILEDGTEQQFDLLVCADGYRSLGRSHLFPDIQLNYAGYIAWRGVLAEAALSDNAPLQDSLVAVGFHKGNGAFYLVPGEDGSTERGKRLVNWVIYIHINASELAAFLTDKNGNVGFGSIPPGAMTDIRESELRDLAHEKLPAYFADICEQSPETFIQAIFDTAVPAYRKGRICLVGDAGALARPQSAAGTFKAMSDALELAEAIVDSKDIDAALENWSRQRSVQGNELCAYGRQLGRELIDNVPDWSSMDSDAFTKWLSSVYTTENNVPTYIQPEV